MKIKRTGAPLVGLLSGYQKDWFPQDLLAGVAVAAVALPMPPPARSLRLSSRRWRVRIPRDTCRLRPRWP